MWLAGTIGSGGMALRHDCMTCLLLASLQTHPRRHILFFSPAPAEDVHHTPLKPRLTWMSSKKVSLWWYTRQP